LTRPVQALLGVLGWPLRFTLSPAIHSAAFRAGDLDWVYMAWPVPPESLREAVEGLRVLGAVGANVTMPHKASVVPMLDEIGGDAEAVGAVNTLQFSGGRLIGHNTDIEGFERFLTSDAGFDPTGEKVAVLGAGGAARAVVRALGQLGAGHITVVARDRDRAEEIVPLADQTSTAEWSRSAEIVSDARLVVNATPLGSDGGEALPELGLKSGQTVVDLNYQPSSTSLVEDARSVGADAWGGLGMLVHQAAASFRIWTGQPAPLETMSAAALRAVGFHGLGSSATDL
jgi:shikimate dehydrogenase